MTLSAMFTALHALMLSHAQLAALVVSRIYAAQAPEGTALPYIVRHLIAAPKDHTHDGHSPGEAVIQFDIYGTNATQCRAVGDALEMLLDGEAITQGGVLFESIFHGGGEFTGIEESLAAGATTQIHSLKTDYRINFREA